MRNRISTYSLTIALLLISILNGYSQTIELKTATPNVSSNGGNNSVHIGVDSGNNSTGVSNSFFGFNSGLSNTTGNQNTFFGFGSGISNTTGYFNVFLGSKAGEANSTGIENVFVGRGAGFRNTIGNSNVFLGQNTGYNNAGGNSNVFIGNHAGVSNVSGNENLILGNFAGRLNDNSVGKNTFLGAYSGNNNKGEGNVFIGYQSGFDILGSNKLSISNSNSTSPLIYGEFDNSKLVFNANVGIGTNTPENKLQVIGDIGANQGIFTSNIDDGAVFQPGEGNDKCVVFAAGRKIGTGPGYVNTRMVNIIDFPVSNFNPKSTIWFNIVDRADVDRYRMYASTGGATNMILYNKSQEEIFKIYEDGNDNVSVQLAKPNSFLGIGTTNFTDGSETYRLSVKGKMRAEEVKVYTTWADYVFTKEYQLPSLEEVEKHIKEKGHLINVPSGKEIEKSGLFIGEITKIQQEKIEELTLYLIQQKKEIEELKAQMKILLEKTK